MGLRRLVQDAIAFSLMCVYAYESILMSSKGRGGAAALYIAVAVAWSILFFDRRR